MTYVPDPDRYAAMRYNRCGARACCSPLEANVAALHRMRIDPDELADIDRYATKSGTNLWAASSAE